VICWGGCLKCAAVIAMCDLKQPQLDVSTSDSIGASDSFPKTRKHPGVSKNGDVARPTVAVLRRCACLRWLLPPLECSKFSVVHILARVVFSVFIRETLTKHVAHRSSLAASKGMTTYLDGSRYEGHFKDGAMHGKVSLWTPNPSRRSAVPLSVSGARPCGGSGASFRTGPEMTRSINGSPCPPSFCCTGRNMAIALSLNPPIPPPSFPYRYRELLCS